MNLNQSSKLRQTPNLTTGRIVAEDSAAGLLKNPDLLRAYLGVCWRISKTDNSTQTLRAKNSNGSIEAWALRSQKFRLPAGSRFPRPRRRMILRRG